MIWWFLILGVSTLVVVCVAIALYMRLRRHLQQAHAAGRTPCERGSERQIGHSIEQLSVSAESRNLSSSLRLELSWQGRQFKLLALRRTGCLEALRQVALVVGASLLVALCARITIPFAVHAGSADGAEFWRAAGGLDAGQPSRICGAGAVFGRRRGGAAGVQSDRVRAVSRRFLGRRADF